MKKRLYAMLLVLSATLLAADIEADESVVPEPFRGFDSASAYSINYSDLTALFRATVLDVGRSTREVAKAATPKTGTRMTTSVKKSTVNEGNRFYFERFKEDEKLQHMLRAIQKSLEEVPDEAPLKYFSRKEQLAYWLNLYNTTLLNEIVQVYPKRKLKKLLEGRHSILDKKLLNVAGVPLSLNDIEFRILKENYDSDPLILYGLYQGIIGGPNIRRSAYTGENVYRLLRFNAVEFINSNRGTYAKNERDFRVSSFYERNKAFFPNFKTDLKKHLLAFLEDPENSELQAARNIKPDIDDWTVTDVYGTYRQIGGSVADNSAALIGAVRSTSLVDSQPVASISTIHSGAISGKAEALSRFSPDLVVRLKELNLKRQDNANQNATVTVEELGTAEDRARNKEDKKEPDNDKKEDQ